MVQNGMKSSSSGKKVKKSLKKKFDDLLQKACHVLPSVATPVYRLYRQHLGTFTTHR